MVRSITAIAMLAGSLSLAPSAQAQVYAYIDEAGTIHLADTPKDERYKLFLKDAGDYKFKGGRDYWLRLPWVAENEKAIERALAELPFHDHIREAATKHQVDAALVHAVIDAESRYDPKAVSHKGAIGLMQVMPDTGARYGVREKELRNPQRNISAGVRYLAELLDMFDGNLELALAGYNAGEKAVLRYGRKIPPYAETRAYVPRVLDTYRRLRSVTM